jgi:hypothetical protein
MNAPIIPKVEIKIVIEREIPTKACINHLGRVILPVSLKIAIIS